MVHKTDGTDPQRLTTNAASDIEPSFSADGGKIVFTSFRDGNAEIYTMNADGTNQKRLTTNTVADLNAGGMSAYTEVVSAKTLRK